MVTRLAKPVVRRIPTRHFGELIIKLTVEGLMFREHGRRTWYGPIEVGPLYQRAVTAAVQRRRQDARTTGRRSRTPR